MTKVGCVNHDCDVCQAPPFNPDWSLLEATQESLREHQVMLAKYEQAADSLAAENQDLRGVVVKMLEALKDFDYDKRLAAIAEAERVLK